MISQEIIQNAIKKYFAANNALNVEEFIDSFAPDAYVYNAGPISPLTGSEAIRQVAEQGLNFAQEMQVNINRIIFADDGAAVYYTGHIKGKNGRVATIDGIDVFEISNEGKIQAIRFYADPEPIMALF